MIGSQHVCEMSAMIRLEYVIKICCDWDTGIKSYGEGLASWYTALRSPERNNQSDFKSHERAIIGSVQNCNKLSMEFEKFSPNTHERVKFCPISRKARVSVITFGLGLHKYSAQLQAGVCIQLLLSPRETYRVSKKTWHEEREILSEDYSEFSEWPAWGLGTKLKLTTGWLGSLRGNFYYRVNLSDSFKRKEKCI